MFITKNKIAISLFALTWIVSMVIIAPVTLFIIVASTVAVLLINHFIKDHEIDYKYAVSFITQLIGLILIVASFVSLFALLSNLIVF